MSSGGARYLTAPVLVAIVLAGGCAPDPASQKAQEMAKVPVLQRAKAVGSGLSLDHCRSDPGVQTVTGKVTNTAKSSKDLVVVVSWTNDAFELVGRGVQVFEDVPSDRSVDVSIKAKVGKGATQCLPSLQRGKLAG